MSPVVPHAVFLACLFTASLASARELTVPFVAEHEAVFEGDKVRWNTRVLPCGDPGAKPLFQATVLPLERKGGTVRLDPPFFDDAPLQVVLLGDPNLVFVPNETLAAHRTRHGFEVFHPDQAQRDEVVRCLRERGIHLPPSALLVARKAQKATPPLEGRLVRRQDGAKAVLGVSAALLAGALGVLAIAWRRLERRVRLEAAEAILKADMPDL